MIILIETFIGYHLGTPETLSISLDTDSRTISAQTDNGSNPRPFYESYDRGAVVEDDQVFSICDPNGSGDLLRVRASYNAPFGYLEVDPNAAVCVAQGPQGDLHFVDVTVTNETEQGSCDGTITAAATSSFGGIEYSID